MGGISCCFHHTPFNHAESYRKFSPRRNKGTCIIQGWSTKRSNDKDKWIGGDPRSLTMHSINLRCPSRADTVHTRGKTSAAWGSFGMWAPCKLSSQIAFLELIISFYVIHLSMVIVCQSNAVTARYEVECKFCLGNSSLCTKRGWPRCRIYIYNYSHDTIISHHNSSARDVSSDREQALHSAYQTAAWQAWHHAAGPLIYTMQSLCLPLFLSVSLSFCVPLILNVCLSQCLCPCNSRRLSPLVSQNTEHAVFDRGQFFFSPSVVRTII